MACQSVFNFNTTPGGSVDISGAFSSGAAGPGSSTRRYRIVGYDNGNGYNYGSGPVGSDGTLDAGNFSPEGSGASFNPDNLSFNSEYDYPEYMTVIVEEPGDDCQPDPPCNCPEPVYSEPETCAGEICAGESKVIDRTLINGSDFDECCEMPLPVISQTIFGTFVPGITVTFTSGKVGSSPARGEMCYVLPGCPEPTIKCVPIISGSSRGGGLEDGVYTTGTKTRGRPEKGSYSGWSTAEEFEGTGRRGSILIHPDGGPTGTAGCIGVEKGQDMNQIRADLDKMHEAGKCGGNVEVSVTTGPGVESRKAGRTTDDGVIVQSEQTTYGPNGVILVPPKIPRLYN